MIRKKGNKLNKMNIESEFCYIDKASLFILTLLILVLFCLTGFLITLGIIGYLISIVYLIGFIRIINHVVAFRRCFLIVKYFVFWKKVFVEDVVELKCELTGLGRSRDIQIFMYYLLNEKVEKSTFLHFRLTGYRFLLIFLNHFNGKIKIDDVSFEILGIKKINNEYVLSRSDGKTKPKK